MERHQALSPATFTYSPTTHWCPAVRSYLVECFGEDHVRQLSRAVCLPPLVSCVRANTTTTTTTDALLQLREQLDSSHPGGKLKCRAHPLVKGAILIQGSGPHAVDYSAAEGKQVVVSRKTGESVLRGARVYAPGVLSCSSGVSCGDLVAVSMVLDDPGGKPSLNRGSTFECLTSPPANAGMYIGLGRAAMSRRQMFREGGGLAVEVVNPVFCSPSCGDVGPGVLFPQNLPSLVAAQCLDPRPGSRVLDMCAAPGGKTTALAQLMDNRGEIVALDRSQKKVEAMQKLADSLKATCITAYRFDATKAGLPVLDTPPPSGQTNSGADPHPCCSKARHPPSQPTAASPAPSRMHTGSRREQPSPEMDTGGVEMYLPEYCDTREEPEQQADIGVLLEGEGIGLLPGSFDHILLDAPCSGLGLRPRLQQGATVGGLQQCAAYQRVLIAAAVLLLKPGGSLVYSTCTINPGENEANVRFLLDKYPSMRLEAQSPHLGGPGLCGPDWLTAEESCLVQRFDPAGPLDTIGFFIAKLRKTT